jgi:hypothetical protein
MVIKLKTGGSKKRTITNVIAAFRIYVKFLNLIKESLFFARAVDALIIIIMGDSIRTAKENATPYAAKLYLGSARRAIIAARKGPSAAIISQVEARGIQKRKIFL